MKLLPFLLFLLLLHPFSLHSQTLSSSDPDSVFAEWLEANEWEGITLYPDIALDWLLDFDSTYSDFDLNRKATSHLLTINVPAGAKIGDWISDSGNLASPVSMKYRIKVKDGKRWDFRFTTNQNAGDSCLNILNSGIPKHLSTGLLIRPGNLLREVILGDFQVNSGFGAVLGSSPVFSLSLGNPASLNRAGKGIRLHSGTDEGRFFRGLAGSTKIGNSEWYLYASGKERLQEEVAGIGYKRYFINSEAGFSGILVSNQYPPVIREGWTEVWQPDSGHFSRMGIWAQKRVSFGIVFGEAGWSPNGGFGWVSGIRWFEAHGFSAVLKYSGCTPGYPVTYTFFQSGTGITKEGRKVIASYRYSPARKLEYLGSVEINLSGWPGSNSHFLNSSTRISQQMKFTAKSYWVVSGSVLFDFVESGMGIPEKVTWKMSFDSDMKQSGSVRLKAGIRQQFQGFGGPVTKGTTADCSLTLSVNEKKWLITCGFRVFTVETGTDPVYAYEQDVSFGWSAPVLTGSGTRWFGTIRWKVLSNIDLELKFGETAYSDLKHLSEGNRGGGSGKVQVGIRL